MKESSTNNVYGVFDINNIYGEAVLALQYQELEGEQKEPNPDPSHSGFDILNLKKTKSVTFYEYGIHSDNFDRSILGDATGETNGWYQSEATFISQQNPWFIRGRNHIFSFAAFDGDARENVTYRVVIES